MPLRLLKAKLQQIAVSMYRVIDYYYKVFLKKTQDYCYKVQGSEFNICRWMFQMSEISI